jgi:Flp pilus assembly protein protease CpaA
MIYPEIVLIVLALVWLVFASIQDWRTREVSDWLNLSLLAFALGFRFFWSLFEQQWSFFLFGLFGIIVFLVLANVFYYSRIFAGGDAKLMMALGAVLPFGASYWENSMLFFQFLMIFLIVAVIYGLTWSFCLMFAHWNDFKKQIVIVSHQKKKFIFHALPFALLFFILGFLFYYFFLLSFVVIILPFLYFFAKSVDEACMVHSIPLTKAREGDWLYKAINTRKGKVNATWEGLTKKDILFLKKNWKKSIVIREGVPFVPVFLFSFLLYVILWYSSNSVFFWF